MRYGSPESFWLLAAVGALLVLHVVRLARRGRRLARAGDPALIARLTDSASVPMQVLRVLLLCAGLSLLVLAAARPQLGGTAVKTRQAGIDIVLALDVSQSMDAKDVAPSRLLAARYLLEGVLTRLGANRVGLVPFAGIAFPQCPLTNDFSAIRVYLRDLRTDTIPLGGTAIGRAVVQGIRLLGGAEPATGEEGPAVAQPRLAKERVIVLITDGEDHESEPLQAAESAAQEGIRVFAVGIGSVAGEPIPLYHPDGSLQGYLKDRDGKFVYSRLDEETLKAVAEKTNGLYLPYGEGTADALSKALDELEKTELEASIRRQYDERFQYALAPGLLLLLLEALLGDRVRRLRRRRPA